jgi:hypothetical protein
MACCVGIDLHGTFDNNTLFLVATMTKSQKIALVYILSNILVFLHLYVAFAFSSADFNFVNWRPDLRVVFSFIWLIASIFITFVYWSEQ